MPKKQWTHGVDSHNLVLCHRAFTINKSQQLGITQCTSPGSVALSQGDSGLPVGWVWAGNPCQHSCVTGWLTVSDHPSSHRWCWKEGRGIAFSPVGKWGGDSTLQTEMWPSGTKGGLCQVTNQHLGTVSAMPWAPWGFGPVLCRPALCHRVTVPWMSVCRGCVQTWGTSDIFPWNKLPANFLTFSCWGAGEEKNQTFLLRSCPNYWLFIIWEIILYI